MSTRNHRLIHSKNWRTFFIFRFGHSNYRNPKNPFAISSVAVLRHPIYFLVLASPSTRIFLEECAKSLNKAVERPPIEVLGKRCRRKVIERLMKNISDDSGTEEMIQQLCIAGAWTDDLIRRLVAHFNPNTYKKTKNLSFVRAEVEKIDGRDKTVFRVDEVLQRVMLDYIKNDSDLRDSIEEMIDSMERTANKFATKNRLEGATRLRRRLVELKQEIRPLPKKFSVALVPDAVDRIKFTLTLDGAHSFDQVSNIKLRIIEAGGGHAEGLRVNGGLVELCRKFGVEIE